MRYDNGMVRLQMRSQLQLREAKGNDSTRESRWEGGERRGGERRYRYGGFYNGQEGHRVYTFLLRFYACQPVSLGLIVETVGTL